MTVAGYTYARISHAGYTLLWTRKLMSKIGIPLIRICKVEDPPEHVS